MVNTKHQPTKDRVALRGRTLYVRKIRPKLSGEKKGRVVAVDIRSADYQVADSATAAARQLRARRPKAEIWLERIGYPALLRFGSWNAKESRQ